MKQRAKVLIALSAFFVLSAFSLTPVSARPPPIFNLPGLQINLLYGTGLTFNSDEATKIIHGFDSTLIHGDKSWSEFSLEEKIEFLETANFNLYIREVGDVDWQSIRLSPFFWYDRDTDIMYSLRIKVFPRNTFDPGTYEFKGVWYLEVNGSPEPWSDEIIRTVIVSP